MSICNTTLIKKLSLVLASVVVVIAARIFGEWVRDDGIDWNPFISAEAQLQGDWLTSKAVLKLRTGTYVCNGYGCQQFGAEGTWNREGDFYVHFVPISHEPQMLRIGMHEGNLVLATGAIADDPDNWNTKVVLHKVRP